MGRRADLRRALPTARPRGRSSARGRSVSSASGTATSPAGFPATRSLPPRWSGTARPLRAVPASEWFTTELRRACCVPGSGHGILMLIPRARRAFDLALLERGRRRFASWYVNLEQPHVWHELAVATPATTLLDLTCDAPTSRGAGRTRTSSGHGRSRPERSTPPGLPPRSAPRASASRRLIERWEPRSRTAGSAGDRIAAGPHRDFRPAGTLAAAP